MAAKSNRHPSVQDQPDKSWLDLQHHSNKTIVKPNELEKYIKDPPKRVDGKILDHIHGSLIGMALGDALGAHVEFRPHQYLVKNPVTDLKGGGTWGLEKGQFTDDTSMALCLASSLIARADYVPYDQLVRYKWWYRDGYMSSTGKCFDIGAATKHSVMEFEERQQRFAGEYGIPLEKLDSLSNPELLEKFDVNCSEDGVAGNGALMRLAPVPLFFYLHPADAVEYSGRSGKLTHGDRKAYDACRYYGALIVAAVNGATKEQLLNKNFYKKNIKWFGDEPLHPEIENIAEGSYQKEEGYDQGIRGKGYVVSALEAALWAFWSDGDSFEKGVLAAINLGDDTDTTAAIYGQLAGAYYGYDKLPKKWVDEVYAKDFIECLSKWIAYEGKNWSPAKSVPSTNLSVNDSEKNPRPRRGTVFDPTRTLKTPGSDEQSASNRAKSADRPNLPSKRKQIYFLDNFKSADDVYRWFVELGDNYVTYADTFKKHNIDAYWLLNQTDDKNLAGYGVERKDHRQAILNGIERLRKQCPVQFSMQE